MGGSGSCDEGLSGFGIGELRLGSGLKPFLSLSSVNRLSMDSDTVLIGTVG